MDGSGRKAGSSRVDRADDDSAVEVAVPEKSLGGKVLVQSGQGWELTDLGTTAMSVAEGIEAAMAGLGGERHSIAGTLRVACPEGFSVHVATPAAVALQKAHPSVSVEIFPVIQRARQHRSGLDLEIVVEEPTAPRARCIAHPRHGGARNHP